GHPGGARPRAPGLGRQQGGEAGRGVRRAHGGAAAAHHRAGGDGHLDARRGSRLAAGKENNVTKYQLGMLGVRVMGRNLAWNIADHGYSVAAWNREPEMLDEVLAAAPGALHGTRTLEELVGLREAPRR